MIVDRPESADAVVLIVLDDGTATELDRVLRRLPNRFFVPRTRDGGEAIARIEAARRGEVPCPEVVILDLDCLESNGAPVLARLRRDPAFDDVVAVALTAADDVEGLEDAHRRGADAALGRDLTDEGAAALGQVFVDLWFKGRVTSLRDSLDYGFAPLRWSA